MSTGADQQQGSPRWPLMLARVQLEHGFVGFRVIFSRSPLRFLLLLLVRVTFNAGDVLLRGEYVIRLPLLSGREFTLATVGL